MTWWALLRLPRVPVTTMRTGSVSSASAGTVTNRPAGVLALATTAARSAGTSAVPRGASPGARVATTTGSGADTAYVAAPSSVGVSANSALSRSTGVKRHSSSRPVGMPKSATSNEVLRSARDWSGTNAAPESVWPRPAGAGRNPEVVGSDFSNSGISRLLLPSAAR